MKREKITSKEQYLSYSKELWEMFKTNPSETDDMYELNKLIDEWEKPNLKNEKPTQLNVLNI